MTLIEQPRAVDGTFGEKTHTAPDVALGLGGTGDAFVIVEGGLVQNSPALPVIDLDFLGDSNVTEDDITMALETRARAASIGLEGVVEEVDEWGTGREGWTVSDPSHMGSGPVGDDYVLIRGGLVQNSPSVPVIDLDFLNERPDQWSIEDAENARADAETLGLDVIVRRIEAWLPSE